MITRERFTRVVKSPLAMQLLCLFGVTLAVLATSAAAQCL
jgi:hypothetical protein